MKAALFYGGSDIRVESVPDPVPGPGEVLVAPHATGICGSDLHGYHRTPAVPRPPRIAGHELAGVVRAVGADVAGFAVGDRVVCEPTISCNRCSECLSGNYNLCSTGLIHIGSPHRPGAFAELLAVPEQVVYRLPDSVSFEAGALIEVYAVAVHACGVTPVAPGDCVAVIGSGPVGLTIAQVAAAAGARVIVLGKPDAALQVAARAAGCRTVNVDTEDAVEAVGEWSGGRFCNVVFEAVGGAHTPLDQACRIAGYRGASAWWAAPPRRCSSAAVRRACANCRSPGHSAMAGAATGRASSRSPSTCSPTARWTPRRLSPTPSRSTRSARRSGPPTGAMRSARSRWSSTRRLNCSRPRA
jgi:L-iditol 2-dehydrogenase